MSRKLITLVLLVVIGAIGAFFLLRSLSPSSEAIAVASEDGSATLQIPKGALPKDVNPADLGIRREEIPIELATDGLITYKLSPAGLELNQPATLKLELPVEVTEDGVRLPLVEHIGAGGIRQDLANAQIDIDPSLQLATFQADIRSFSWIATNYSGPLFYAADVVPNRDSFTVGENFELVGLVGTYPRARPDDRDITFYFSENGGTTVDYEFVDDLITVSEGRVLASSEIEPRDIRLQPNVEDFTLFSDDEVIRRADLACGRAGLGGDDFSLVSFGFAMTANLRVTRMQIREESGQYRELELSAAAREPMLRERRYSVALHLFCTAGVAVEMISYQGAQFPAVQFRVAKPDACRSEHYHALNHSFAFTRDRQAVSDPGDCGYGAVESTPVEMVEMSPSEAQELSDFLEANSLPAIPIP